MKPGRGRDRLRSRRAGTAAAGSFPPMPESTMQAQIVHELAPRFWLIDHSRAGLDMSPQAILRLVTRALQRDDWRPWLMRELSRHYRTALQGHSGKPDLLLTRPKGGRTLHGLAVPTHTVPRAIYAELKSLTGKIANDQLAWLLSLADAGAEVWIVDPSNLADFYAATVPLDAPPRPGLHAPKPIVIGE